MAYYPSCTLCKRFETCDWKEEYEDRIRKFDRMCKEHSAEFNHWSGLAVTMSCLYFEEVKYDS